MLNKKHMRDSMGLVAFGVGTGVGMSVMKDLGADTSGLAKISSAAKPIGGIIATRMVLDSLGDLQKSVEFPKRKKLI